MWTGHNPARQRAALYENFCKVPVPSDHETLLSSISYAALQHGFHSTFYSFRASAAHIMSTHFDQSARSVFPETPCVPCWTLSLLVGAGLLLCSLQEIAGVYTGFGHEGKHQVCDEEVDFISLFSRLDTLFATSCARPRLSVSRRCFSFMCASNSTLCEWSVRLTV
jgi:hypothetical protein